jgi:hypothetical protein
VERTRTGNTDQSLAVRTNKSGSVIHINGWFRKLIKLMSESFGGKLAGSLKGQSNENREGAELLYISLDNFFHESDRLACRRQLEICKTRFRFV